MNRIIIIAALAIAIGAGIWVAAERVYTAGFKEAQRIGALEAEKARVTAQAKINTIEKQALEKIASQTSSNVEKAIADVRKTNPACSIVVPSSVLDALRKK